MRAYMRIFLLTVLLLLSGYALWPLLHPYFHQIKLGLIAFKQFCRAYPALSYLIYGALFALILFLGLPIATALMLLAGITYEFWQATALVMACRMLVAVVAFILARRMIEPPKRYQQKPWLFRKFENHPRLGLLLMRLAPLPDSTVNFTMGASPIRTHSYVLLSFLGMIPLTVLCIWIGGELGSVTRLMRFLD